MLKNRNQRQLGFVVVAFLLSACSSSGKIKHGDHQTVNHLPETPKVMTRNHIPHLWSDHKVLDIPVEKCAAKSKEVLLALGFKNIVMNGNFVYGNYVSNRATIKCVDMRGVSFVYTAVAGKNVESVKSLRNQIVWKL